MSLEIYKPFHLLEMVITKLKENRGNVLINGFSLNFD